MPKDERSVLESYLGEHGQKMTAPRATVLDAFLGIERHVTVWELYEAAKRIDPGIGQATVFRAIKLLAKAGLARETCGDEGPRRYEHAFLHEHHDHLVCVECGAMVEFSEKRIERAQDAIYEKYGFEAVEHRLELFGLCPACRKAKPAGRAKER